MVINAVRNIGPACVKCRSGSPRLCWIAARDAALGQGERTIVAWSSLNINVTGIAAACGPAVREVFPNDFLGHGDFVREPKVASRCQPQVSIGVHAAAEIEVGTREEA